MTFLESHLISRSHKGAAGVGEAILVILAIVLIIGDGVAYSCRALTGPSLSPMSAWSLRTLLGRST
jgi:hypothetical protein